MKKIFILILAAMTLGSCNYLDVDPVGQVIPHTKGDYRAMLTKAYEGFPLHKAQLKWASDEVGDMSLLNNDYMSTILNTTWRFNDINSQQYNYQAFYKTIFYVNEIIDKTMTSDDDGSGEDRKQIMAEAYALRAYCYFDLLNMYAKWYDPATAATDKGVPVTTLIDIQQAFPRTTIEQGYKQVFDDIESAKAYMQIALQPTTGNVTYKYRFSQRSLKALEARMRLYHGEYDKAYELATEIIAQESEDFKLANLVEDKKIQPYSTFSSENILSLDSPFVKDAFNMDETLIADSYAALYKADDNRYNSTSDLTWGYIQSFEAQYGTEFFEDWGIDLPLLLPSHRCLKWKNRVSVRLSEMYLIAAETALKKSSISETDARKYLGELQAKRITTPLDLSTLSGDALLAEVMDERARELVFEGHRWFDLRRTTRPLLRKTVVTSVSLGEFGETIPTTMDYSMSTPNLYILPFPRSAVDNNPYLRD